ncbi:sugar transporter SWEET1-like [Planococcus citri]|uniref:sugar transporter SWEET1-like n=1 Tax=Planococcus citri TaxID=170843 RepID=UPI0031F8A5C9
MSLIRYQYFVSKSAFCATMCQLFSGCLLCRKYIKQGSTKNDSSFPYVVGLISSSMWMYYGILTNNDTLVYINVIGCTLFISYITIFYLYTPFKHIIRRQLLFIVLVLTLIATYSQYEEDRNLLKSRIGFLCCLVGVSFCAAPLSNVIHVIKTKDAESLPVPMITMTAIVTFLWYLYGVCLNDTFIMYPNLIGFSLSAFQLMLYLAFLKREKPVVYSKMTVA